MSWMPRPVSPRAAFADFRAFLRHREREHWIGAVLAVLVTLIIVIEFIVDAKINTAPPPQIIYAEEWRADRTDEQIVADQKKHQAARDAARKEKQRQFQKLEKQLGIE
jgi:Na+-transporting methylmalonyl-CoA/oxaloacetate decarboxylase gamma subunit